nr:HEXXH motif-containing putative peptide modification protein [Glaciimonas sp. PCH181]
MNELGQYSQEHKAFFELIITDVFIMPSTNARGGSTSAALGVIWENPKLHYPINDVVEFLVHEMTHHTMFMDELCHEHYDYNLILSKSNWASSAILNVPRPLDKVLHSIVVGLEILQFRCKFLGHPVIPNVHPPSDCLLSQLKLSLISIREVIDREKLKGNSLLKPRAMEILNNVQSNIDVMKLSSS